MSGPRNRKIRWVNSLLLVILYFSVLPTHAQYGGGTGEPNNPNPADGSINPDTWVNLSWSPRDTAISYDVYFGDNFEDVNRGAEDTFQGNQAETAFIVGFPGFPYPDGLVPGTTYYWRVDEVNDTEPNSPWKGDVWSFSIPPKTAYAPDPADAAEMVDPDTELIWAAGFGAKLHTVYFGDNFDGVNNATGGLPGGVTTYDPGTLKLAHTYYWRVDEFDVFDTYKGDVWSFTTEGAVGSPDPANGAVDVKQTKILTWTPGVYSASYQVYFGTDKDAVKNADTGSPEYKGTGNLGSESYDPGTISLDTKYYWRIDEVNNANPDSPWKGNVWSFTTANFLVVDDFESYNDIDPDDPKSNRIWNTWIDGYDDPTNGSLVGYEVPPWVKQTIVHTGTESMSLYYDNSVGISEATANIANLEIGQNWTESGVETLSLWFYGDPSNAPEPMYVALADANGSTAVVYHDSPNTTQITTWREWRIDLQAFADQGVDLTNIDTISIGFGNRNNPVAGGSGWMYFDDIRLYRPAEPETETGETTILGTWSWNVETDTLVRSSNTDFCWVHVTSTERYLLPINGAQAAVVTGRSFDEIDSAFVNSLTLSSQKLSGSDVGSVLTPGAVIAFRTSEGNKGKLRIEGYRALHDFSFPEASYMDEGWKSYALTKPNIEKYHLHVKWCLF